MEIILSIAVWVVVTVCSGVLSLAVVLGGLILFTIYKEYRK